MLIKANSKMSNSSEQLWTDFVLGDMNAFRKIYETHYELLYNFGLKYLNKEETEDNIQSLFLHLLQNRTSIGKIIEIKAYLFISLRNNIFKILKKKYNKVPLSDSELLLIEVEPEPKDDLINEVINFIKKLSPRENQIVQMKYIEGYKNMEIAKILEIDYQTVRNILVNAMKKMRQIPYYS